MAGYKVYLGLNGSDVNVIIKAKPSIAVIDFNNFQLLNNSQIRHYNNHENMIEKGVVIVHENQ